MKPKFAHKIIQSYPYTPSTRMDIRIAIRRELKRLGRRPVVRVSGGRP